MAFYSVMIKPASSLCNLRCRYCFYNDISDRRETASYGIMKEMTTEAIVKNIFATLQQGDSLAIAFQGGEPTLAGLSYFKHFVETIRKQSTEVTVSYAIQTNGITLDEEWCAFFRKHQFLVGLSMDGYAAHHNAYRVDHLGKSTFAQVKHAKLLLDTMGVEYNVLCTVTNALARHPQKVWRFLMEEHIRYIQFTPCLGALEGNAHEWRLTPQRFHSFYLALYALWKQEVQKGRYISIKLFDDIVNLFVRKQVTVCGLNGQCQIQCIVESDGSIYPCDFYALDRYCGGSLAEQSLHEMREELLRTGFLSARADLPSICHACQYHKICHGGCKRLFESVYVDEVAGFCGYQSLLDDIGQDLCETGMKLLGASRLIK